MEFESPIKELNEQIQKLKDSALKTGVNVDTAVQELERALEEKTREIYKNLDPWQRVQLSRHPFPRKILESVRLAATSGLKQWPKNKIGVREN